MMPYRQIKRPKNEIEFLTEQHRERYFRRVLWINAILVVGLLSAIIILK